MTDLNVITQSQKETDVAAQSSPAGSGCVPPAVPRRSMPPVTRDHPPRRKSTITPAGTPSLSTFVWRDGNGTADRNRVPWSFPAGKEDTSVETSTPAFAAGALVKSMPKGRLEAFSDGVIAIIITIMVFGLKVPHGDRVEELKPLLPVFLSYVLSFVYVGIYWNNHHHMLHTCTTVTSAMLWANLHLLFWLSLFPFATGWMGENNFSAPPTVLYGCVLLMAAIAYLLLQRAIIRAQGSNSILEKAVGRDWKGKVSPVLYLAAIVVALRSPRIADAVFVGVALLWFVPDRRIEKLKS